MTNFYHEAGALKTYGVHPWYPRHPWLVLLVPALPGWVFCASLRQVLQLAPETRNKFKCSMTQYSQKKGNV
jgi:hypothetical protein